MRYIVLLLTLLVSVDVSAETLTDSWTNRGIDALTKLVKLNEKNGDSKGKSLSKQDHCDWQLENAFSAFADPKMKDTFFYSDKNRETFKLFLVEKKDGSKGLTQIDFTFALGKKELEMVSVRSLAVGHRVLALPKAPNNVSIMSDTCLFHFDLRKPLSPTTASL